MNGINYLNAHWLIEWPQHLQIAGTMFKYKRPNNEPETLSSRGPTSTDLEILVRTHARAFTGVKLAEKS